MFKNDLPILPANFLNILMPCFDAAYLTSALSKYWVDYFSYWMAKHQFQQQNQIKKLGLVTGLNFDKHLFINFYKQLASLLFANFILWCNFFTKYFLSHLFIINSPEHACPWKLDLISWLSFKKLTDKTVL